MHNHKIFFPKRTNLNLNFNTGCDIWASVRINSRHRIKIHQMLHNYNVVPLLFLSHWDISDFWFLIVSIVSPKHPCITANWMPNNLASFHKDKTVQHLFSSCAWSPCRACTCQFSMMDVLWPPKPHSRGAFYTTCCIAMVRLSSRLSNLEAKGSWGQWLLIR